MNGTLRQDLSILDTLETAGCSPLQEDALMSSHSKSGWSDPRKKPRSRKRHRRHRRGRDYADDSFADDSDYEGEGALDALEGAEPQVLSHEEYLYRDARMLAEDRAELLLRAGKRLFIVVLLLVFLPPLGIVAMLLLRASPEKELIAGGRG